MGDEAEVEAALPEGWAISELRWRSGGWLALAWSGTSPSPWASEGEGDTPAAALRALAAKLRERT